MGDWVVGWLGGMGNSTVIPSGTAKRILLAMDVTDYIPIKGRMFRIAEVEIIKWIFGP
jgi:hypothetical protein